MKKIFLVITFCVAQICAMDFSAQIDEVMISQKVEESCFVAEYKGRNVGCLYYEMQPDDSLYIASLRVNEGFRKKKVGSALLAKALLYCFEERITKVSLLAFPDYTKDYDWVVRFYERFGFSLVSIEGDMIRHFSYE